jgi:hypothetical protein
MRTVAILAAILASAVATPAKADCKCRAPGFIAHHGQVACLRTPEGYRLARCGMSLNNSAWIFTQESCPQASADSRRLIGNEPPNHAHGKSSG